MDEREYQAAGGAKAHTPDPNAYHDPAMLRLLSQGGRSVADSLPTRNGLRGTVIPRSTALGGSRAKKAHKVGLVQIDPHVPGEDPIKIDISELDEEVVGRAFDSVDGDDISNIAYNTFRVLAGKEPVGELPDDQKMENPIMPERQMPNAYTVPRTPSGKHTAAEKVANSRPAVFIGAPTVPIAQSPVEHNQLPDLDALTEPLAVSTPNRVLSIPLSERLSGAPAVSSINTSVQPPTHKVTFEIAGFGTFETAYHRVVQGEDGISLVLVYDTRFQGGLKYFPQASDNELFVDVHDLPYIFKVRSAGLKYKIDDSEHCVLLVEKSAPKDE
jgi:hypothetical protein